MSADRHRPRGHPRARRRLGRARVPVGDLPAQPRPGREHRDRGAPAQPAGDGERAGDDALLISYLPALYGAYGRREARLLTLDDPEGGRLTPVRVIAVHAPGDDVAAPRDFCREWETWVAEVLESHVSYPMLGLFRSQHPGQSWVTALGVVTDAATLTCACVEGEEVHAPYFLHRRGRRAVIEIARRLHVPDRGSDTWLDRPAFEAAWERLLPLGLPLRDQEEAWRRLGELRATYGERLQQLIDHLLAPHGFCGHSAETVVEDEVAEATAAAQRRTRRDRL